MSHFTRINMAVRVQHEAEFVAALRARFGQIVVNESGTALFGFQGDDRNRAAGENFAPLCEIVIRRKYLWPYANDIGFKRNIVTGTYDAYISEYDKPQWEGAKDMIAQEYALSVTEKKLKAEGYTTNRTTLDNGYVRVTATDYR